MRVFRITQGGTDGPALICSGAKELLDGIHSLVGDTGEEMSASNSYVITVGEMTAEEIRDLPDFDGF